MKHNIPSKILHLDRSSAVSESFANHRLCETVYNRLGYHWASSLLAFLTVLMAPFP